MKHEWVVKENGWRSLGVASPLLVDVLLLYVFYACLSGVSRELSTPVCCDDGNCWWCGLVLC